MSNALTGARIVFDLDGTLVDTAPDLVRALNSVIGAEGLAPIPVELVRHMVGRGARVLIQRAFERDGRTLSEAESATLTSKFLDNYRGEIDAHSQPFPHVLDGLDALDAAGARLSVATNKPTDLAELLLEKLEMAERFERIVGPDATPAKKPAADHLFSAAGPGAEAARMALVGDSETDVGAARAAGCPVVVMAYGYTETPPDKLGADRVLEDFRTLVPALESLLGSIPAASSD